MQQMLLGAGGAAAPIKYWYNMCDNTITQQNTPISGANQPNLAQGWGYSGSNNGRMDCLSIQVGGTGTYRVISMGHGSITGGSGTTLSPTSMHIIDGLSVNGTMLWQKTGQTISVGYDASDPESFAMIDVPESGDSGYGTNPVLLRGGWYTIGFNAPSGYSQSTSYRNSTITPTTGTGSDTTGIKTFTHNGQNVIWYVKKATFPNHNNFTFNGTSTSSGQLQGLGIEIIS